MFERDEQIQRLIGEVYALTVDLKRGEILTHEAIKAVLRVAPHEGSWDHVVNTVRRRLERERGIATWHEVLVGYKLLTDVEQIQVGSWRTRKALRQIRRGMRSVDALPEAGLTLNKRKAKAVAYHSLRDQAREIRRSIKQQDALFALRPVTPRRPVMEGES